MNRLLPRNEARRLAELRSHEIMDTAPEPSFDRVVRLATRFFAMPIAAIACVDEFRVWYKASQGLLVRESARETSFCARAILRDRVLVMHDTWMDECSRAGRPAVGGVAVRFYAGAPLRTASGHALGTLCVMDTAPRAFTQEDDDTLADMAAMVIAELTLRHRTARLRAEIAGGRRKEVALVRQDHLVRRLRESLESRVHVRTGELARANESLRADLARRERSSAILVEAREEAERANRAKSEFLAGISHELRTPLNAILGFGEILRGPLPEEERRDCAGHIVTAGKHLLGVIDEVLDLARIESGREKLFLVPVHIMDVIAETLDLIRPLAETRGLTLEVTGARESGRVVVADRQRLKQVLLNLLSNAVKYSPPSGRITVRCRAGRARTLRLTVTDDGPGITRERAERLFVAFDRLGEERSNVPGTGLGLSLSKRFIEAMNGTIGMSTASGGGSAFWIRLPLSIVSGASVSPETGSPFEPGRKMAVPGAGPSLRRVGPAIVSPHYP